MKKTTYFFQIVKKHSIVGDYYTVKVYKLSEDGKGFIARGGLDDIFSTMDDCEKYMNEYRKNHPEYKEIETRIFN